MINNIFGLLPHDQLLFFRKLKGSLDAVGIFSFNPIILRMALGELFG